MTKARKNKIAKRKALQEWSKEVRTCGKCEVCGKTEYLDAHHILPKETYSHLSLNRENGICVCKYHHKFGRLSFHRNPLWASAWLEKNKPLTYKWAMDKLEEEHA